MPSELPNNLAFLKDLKAGNLFRLAIVKISNEEEKTELSEVVYSKINHNLAKNTNKDKQVEMNAYTPVCLVAYDPNTPILLKLNDIEAQNLLTGETVLVGEGEKVKEVLSELHQ